MLSRFAEVLGAALLLCAPMLGIDRDLRINQLNHTAWTYKDGAPTQIRSLAQTTDGFLWIGDATGLYRFDGLHFGLYEPPGGLSLPSTDVIKLLAVPDGGLWVSFSVGMVSFLRDGKITTYRECDGRLLSAARSMVRDQQGFVWMAEGTGGLKRFNGSKWETIGAAWKFSGEAFDLLIDHAGTLWVGSYHGVFYLPNGGHTFERPAHLKSAWGPLAEWREKLWMVEWSPPNAPGLRLSDPGSFVQHFDVRIGIRNLLVDQQGSLWVGTYEAGLYRFQYPELIDGKPSKQSATMPDIFEQKDGLTGSDISVLLADREDNLWVATNRGLDRFRQSPLVNVTLPPDTRHFTITPRDHGAVWVTHLDGKGDLFEVRNGAAIPLSLLPSRELSIARKSAVLAGGTTSAYQDSDGVVWLGAETGVLRVAKGKIERIPPIAFEASPTAITKDRDGRLLVSFQGRGLYRWENRRWISLSDLGVPARGLSTPFRDPTGRVWIGCLDNRVILLDGDRVSIFTGKDGITVGAVTTLQERKGRIWISGDHGLQQFDGHRFVTVAAAGGPAFQNVTGFVAAEEDGIWLGERRGIVHIAEGEILRVERNPAYFVRYEAFDVLDGLEGALQPNNTRPNMTQGTDGKIWAATAQGVVWIDPHRARKEPLPPPVSVLSLTANGQKYNLPAPSELKLQPRISRLEVVYTAASLAIPERVRFRYKLEGQDKDWREAGSRRDVSYTNLGPGSYRFHVMASNSEGVWNQAEAVTGFMIQPALYQTYWFYTLCVCAALGLLWELYRFRLRQMSAQMQGRLEVRIAERERIARELHDTLLQGFQGLTLHFQAVMEQIPDREPARQSMKKALTYADAVLLEGRQRVRELRPEGSEIHELSEQIAAYGEELAKDRGVAFNVTVVGSPQPLQPAASDEIYRIAREGLANAIRHSRASKIEVELTYDPASVCLRVRDNGSGIGPEILESGKEGHWGLSGMRERARNICAQLNILSNPGSGTEIDLTLPAKVAYVGTLKKRRWFWIARNKSGGR